MLRFCATSLTALVMAVVGVTAAAASPLLDPIVRTRGGGTGSYEILALPYFFNFGPFPGDPDDLPETAGQGDNCFFTTEGGLPKVTCAFQNLTPQNITQLDFSFSIPGDTSELTFTPEDEGGFWTPPFEMNEFGAHFAGPGIPSGGDFFIDLVNFPEGSNITMVASTEVPEPASLMLLGTGLGLGAAFISKRRQTSTRRRR